MEVVNKQTDQRHVDKTKFTIATQHGIDDDLPSL